MIKKGIYRITELLAYIKNRLSDDPILSEVTVEGEIGNFRPNPSGHWYFSLKDQTGLINCAMFRLANVKTDFLPKDGDQVLATGHMRIYEKSGAMQLIITSMKRSGAGNFYIQFERMLQKLAPLGYFEAARKKSIPLYPSKIAIVTGANTAALKDIQITIQYRWPCCQLLLVPAIVQGNEAISSIVSALKKADSLQADVCILARGGGSVDDLWCFNDELIAQTIFQMKTPIVTGIGHEIDTTIADLVADVRAATPTAAAQRVTPDYREVQTRIQTSLTLMHRHLQQKLENQQQNLDFCLAKLLNQQTFLYKQYRQLSFLDNFLENQMIKKMNLAQASYWNRMHRFKNTTNRFQQSIDQKISNYESILYTHCQQKLLFNQKRCLEQNSLLDQFQIRANQHLQQENKMICKMNQLHYIHLSNKLKMALEQFQSKVLLLDSLSPLKVLARGYSVTSLDEKVVSSIDQVQVNSILSIRVSDGKIAAKVVEKEKIDGTVNV